jgi:hypothetical protein
MTDVYIHMRLYLDWYVDYLTALHQVQRLCSFTDLRDVAEQITGIMGLVLLNAMCPYVSLYIRRTS